MSKTALEAVATSSKNVHRSRAERHTQSSDSGSDTCSESAPIPPTSSEEEVLFAKGRICGALHGGRRSRASVRRREQREVHAEKRKQHGGLRRETDGYPKLGPHGA